ncbi:MAG: hypothetical protein AAB393_19930 [Bacteroidota bacterium]|mgnify:CR=1 FL=1
MMKVLTYINSVAFVALIVVASGCGKKQPPPGQQLTQQNPSAAAAHDVSSAGSVHWTRPEQWAVQLPRQMRIATYGVPAAEGDAEGAECAVFYFGSGQGGDVNANIDRWVSQFEGAGKPEQSSKEVNGLKVTLVQIAGTYLAPGGPMMQSSGKKENYRLLGAIVAAPEGMVFFKFTGPAKTIAAAEGDFNSVINSVAKQ